MSHIFLPAVTALFVLLCGCNQQKGIAQPPRPVKSQLNAVSVTTHSVKPDTFTERRTYHGQIVPINEVQLVCYGGGRVEALRAKEGDFVNTGRSLASIDSGKAILLLKTAQLQEKIALGNLEQTKKHLKDGNASALAVDKAELELLIAKNNRIEAQKNYRGAFAITPITGIITSRPITLYQELSPGSATFFVAHTATMKILFQIDEPDVSFVKPGTIAEISSPLYPEKIWMGTIKTVAREASSENHTFRTEIHLGNSDGLLKSGGTAKITIAMQHHANAILIPSELIYSDTSRYWVFIVTDKNKAMRKMIIPGRRTGSLTIIQEGLSAGDRVISSPCQDSIAGKTVHVSN